MKTVVAGPDELWNELVATLKDSNCVRVSNADEFNQFSSEDVFFNLYEDAAKFLYLDSKAMVFINSPLITLQEGKQNESVFRLNAWKGFLTRNQWEIAGTINPGISDYFLSIKKQFVQTPDVPGFVSSRILSMIINEAYFTLEEGVSTKEEIDIAMKLGTNYPKGPFEWSEEIGLKHVVALLKKLSENDSRYTPAPLLLKESFL